MSSEHRRLLAATRPACWPVAPSAGLFVKRIRFMIVRVLSCHCAPRAVRASPCAFGNAGKIGPCYRPYTNSKQHPHFSTTSQEHISVSDDRRPAIRDPRRALGSGSAIQARRCAVLGAEHEGEESFRVANFFAFGFPSGSSRAAVVRRRIASGQPLPPPGPAGPGPGPGTGGPVVPVPVPPVPGPAPVPVDRYR